MPKSNEQKVTSHRVASTASRLLRSNATGKSTKTVAGSALSQTPSKKSK